MKSLANFESNKNLSAQKMVQFTKVLKDKVLRGGDAFAERCKKGIFVMELSLIVHNNI